MHFVRCQGVELPEVALGGVASAEDVPDPVDMPVQALDAAKDAPMAAETTDARAPAVQAASAGTEDPASANQVS